MIKLKLQYLPRGFSWFLAGVVLLWLAAEIYKPYEGFVKTPLMVSIPALSDSAAPEKRVYHWNNNG